MKTSEDEFIKQFKSTFEDYNDGFADHGWAELRKKYPEKESKKLPIWWLTGVAATLLVVLGLYFYDGLEKQPNSKADQLAGQLVDKDMATSAAQTPSTDQLKQGNSDLETTPHDIKFKGTTATKTGEFNNNEVIATQVPSMKVVRTEPTSLIKDKVVQNDLASVPNTVNSDSSMIANHVVSTNRGVTKTDPSSNMNIPNHTTPSVKKSTEEFLNEQTQLLAKSEKKEQKTKNSSTTFDVFTSTFFNYHDNNDAKLSAGLGLNANIQVSKKLVLSVGAGISQNKVSYENKVPAEVMESMATLKSDVLSMAPTNAVYSATATNDVSFNGRLLSIDLPVSFKFFPTKKQDFYISTGINSSTYLSQKYTYNYSLSNFGIQNGAAQAQQQTEERNLGGFDFANNAIIAVGFNQSLGKNLLIFEPYYKPALNTMGNKNLRISSAGINLRFNFNGNNKK
jgi:hypothetical protein